MGDSNQVSYDAWVGRTEQADDVASAVAATRLAALLDRPTPTTHLTPTGHWAQFTPTATQSELGTDGHPKLGDFVPPLDLPRRMWAGSKIAYHASIALGAAVTKTTTIESITPKEGSTGRLCFVVLRHDVSADGVPALTELQTIVYREATAVDPNNSPAKPPRPAGGTPKGWDWVRALQPNEATLFRFSAVTFNTHRIHYDLPYATGVEGYPGLVVHGPLSATYIVDSFLEQHPGATITSFEFSVRSPIFVNEQIFVVGRATGQGSEELAIIGPDGKPAIAASIEYQ